MVYLHVEAVTAVSVDVIPLIGTSRWGDGDESAINASKHSGDTCDEGRLHFNMLHYNSKFTYHSLLVWSGFKKRPESISPSAFDFPISITAIMDMI